MKKAKHLLGQMAALMSVFSPLPWCSSAGPERPPVGQLQPFDQVLGEALRRSWPLGLADSTEQMLRMGGAGATLDLRGTRRPIWTSSSGWRLAKNGSSRSWVSFLQICGSLLFLWFGQQLDTSLCSRCSPSTQTLQLAQTWLKLVSSWAAEPHNNPLVFTALGATRPRLCWAHRKTASISAVVALPVAISFKHPLLPSSGRVAVAGLLSKFPVSANFSKSCPCHLSATRVNISIANRFQETSSSFLQYFHSTAPLENCLFFLVMHSENAVIAAMAVGMRHSTCRLSPQTVGAPPLSLKLFKLRQWIGHRPLQEMKRFSWIAKEFKKVNLSEGFSSNKST